MNNKNIFSICILFVELICILFVLTSCKNVCETSIISSPIDVNILENSNADPENIAANAEANDTLISADFANYDSIIKMYQKIVELCVDYDDAKAVEGVYDEMFCIPGKIEKSWYNKVFVSTYLYYPQDHTADFKNYKEMYGYALKDLNNDNIDELILLLDDYTVIAFFSMSDGKPILIDSFWPRYRCWIDSRHLLHINSSSGAAYSSSAIYKLSQDDPKLIPVIEIGTSGVDRDGNTIYYKMVGEGKTQISKNEFDYLLKNIFFVDENKESEYEKLNSGLMFNSLFDLFNEQSCED